jgi:hypothetical protein
LWLKWQSACLASTKYWIHYLVLQKNWKLILLR